MAKFRTRHCSVLDDAISAARRALAAMEARDIPDPVVRVAAMTGSRLPPPLAVSLLGELDTNEWFRAEALAQLPEHITGASRDFLERPLRWWMSLEDESLAEATRKTEDRLREIAGDLERCKREMAEAKRRAREAKRQLETARRDVDALIAGEKARLQAVIDRLVADLAAAEAEREEAAAAAAAAEQKAKSAAMEIERTQARLRRTRRETTVSQRHAADGSAPRDPVQLARLLDGIARDVSVSGPGRDQNLEPAASPTFTLAPGVAPDSAAAIDAVATWPAVLRVIVDGFNVAHLIDDGGPPSAAVRRRLEAGLARLRRSAAGSMSIVVIYDSSVEGERTPPRVIDGVEVRYAPHDVIADEEIVAEAAGTSGTVIVISNDREVREAVEDVGGVSLWSDALVAWLT